MIELARVHPGPSLAGRDMEGVLALFRLFLAAAIILALYLEHPEFRHDGRVLALCAFLALAIAAFWQAALDRKTRASLILHVSDMIFAVTLLLLSRENGMLFLIYFTYCILAAAVKWTWRVVLLTGGLLGAVYFCAEFFDWTSHERTLIRSSYLALTTVLLARAAYGAERGRARMLRLAQFIHAHHAPTESGRTLALREACDIMEGDAAFLYWRHDEVWREDRYTSNDGRLRSRRSLRFDAPQERGPMLLLADRTTALTYAGPMRARLDLPRELEDRHGAGMAIAFHGFRNSTTEGALYVVGIRRWRWDHLVLVELVSRHVLGQIESQIGSERRAREAAEIARARFSRDVHDGLLQNLTAVRLQLHALAQETSLEKVRKRTQNVAELLRQEQERLREFIEEARNFEDEQLFSVESLVEFLESTAARWNLTAEVTTAGLDARVSTGQFRELSLIISESIANAARHGATPALRADVSAIDGRLLLSVTNDIKTDGEVITTISPRSMSNRVIRVGGTMSVEVGAGEVTVAVEVPLQG